MKLASFVFATVLAAGMMSVPRAYAEGIENGDRPFYGFFLSNPAGYTNATEDKYGFAKLTFADTGNAELLHELNGGVGVYAATAVDGIYYAIPYLFETSMTMPSPMPMFSYNVYTGQVLEIGPWSDGNTDLKPSDMTYDRKNDRILALCFGSQEGSGIYELDRKSGTLTLLRKLNNGSGVIAADAFGRVFTINHEGQLMQIDMEKDFSEKVLFQLPYSYLSANQSLEFDVTSGKIYWASQTYENPTGNQGRGTYLVEITLPAIAPDADYSADMKGYESKEYSEIGFDARFLGMYIPYATGGFDAPGFAADLVTVPGEDGKSCKIEFKVPSTTFGGSPLASIDGYDIFRDGERIYTGKGVAAAGESITYTDTEIPVSGTEYRYDIVCYSNTKGDGPKTPAFAYVGQDAPVAPKDVNVDVASDFVSVNLSWTAPAEGLHGGAFDPSKTRYDVVRLPDNVTVASDLTECKATDKLRRLLRYSYRIIAKNDFGQSAVTTADFIAGTPVDEFPVEETFDSPAAMELKWTNVDNNGDGMTWIYGSSLGRTIFGDYEMAAEYILSPTSVDSYTQDADDWIISPPILFESGKKYHVTLEIRSLTNELLNLYCGPMNTVDKMSQFKTFTLNEPEFIEAEDGTGYMAFQKYSFNLPENVAGGISCLAIQLATPMNDERYSYIQIGNILIDEGEVSAVQSVTESDAAEFHVIDGAIVIDGGFDKAALYSLNGIKMMDIRDARTSLGNLEGVYILMIDGRSHKIMLK